MRKMLAEEMKMAGREVWRLIDSSEYEQKAKGLELFCKLVDRRARLFGLNAPEQTAVELESEFRLPLEWIRNLIEEGKDQKRKVIDVTPSQASAGTTQPVDPERAVSEGQPVNSSIEHLLAVLGAEEGDNLRAIHPLRDQRVGRFPSRPPGGWSSGRPPGRRGVIASSASIAIARASFMRLAVSRLRRRARTRIDRRAGGRGRWRRSRPARARWATSRPRCRAPSPIRPARSRRPAA